MIEVGNNIYCNWNWSQSKTSKKVSALLFGYCGVGKSRLMNNLCGANQKVGIARKTITQQLYNKYVKLPQNCTFSLYDSPGIHKNDIRGSNILRRSLRFLQWNVIIVQAKLQARFQDSTLTQLAKLTKIFSNQQSKKVIFLISHADILDQQNNKDKILKEFRNCLDTYFKDKKVILFSNENSNFEKLAKIIYSCAVQFNPTTIDIEDKKFCKTLGYEVNKDTLEDELRKWQADIKCQPQNKRPDMLEKLKITSPQIHDTLKYKFIKIDNQLPESQKLKINQNKKQDERIQKKFQINTTYTSSVIKSSMMNKQIKNQHRSIEKKQSQPISNSRFQKIPQTNSHIRKDNIKDIKYIPKNNIITSNLNPNQNPYQYQKQYSNSNSDSNSNSKQFVLPTAVSYGRRIFYQGQFSK